MYTHNLCFEQKYEKYQSFLSENFQFLDVKSSIYLNRQVFVMHRNFLSEKFSFLVIKFSVYLNRHVFVMWHLTLSVVGPTVIKLVLFFCTVFRLPLAS